MNWRYFTAVRAARRYASSKPAIFFPLARMAGNRQLLNDQTELVVDGYPRSANSYMEAAFLHSQGERGVRLATHAHSAAHIIRAVDLGLPTIVLLRHPDQAVTSMMSMVEAGDPDPHFRDYCAFYKPLLAYQPGYVTAEFSQVFKRFAELVGLVNAHFASDFAVPDTGEQFDRGVSEMRDKVSVERTGRVPNYSADKGQGELAERKTKQDELLASIQSLDGLASRRKAIALYERLLARAELA